MKRMYKKKCNKLNNKGMTLVEMLVAMLIFSMASIAFIQVLSFSLKLNTDAKVKQHALSFSQSLMESMKAFDINTLDTEFSSASNSAFRVFTLSDGDGSSKSVSMSGDNRTYSLTNVDFNGEKYDAQIIVTPTSNVEHKVQLVALEEINRFNDGFVRLVNNEQTYITPEIVALLEKPVADGGYGAKLGETLDYGTLAFDSRVVNVNIASDDTVTVVVTYNYTLTGETITKVDPTTGADVVETVPAFSGTVTYDYNADGSAFYDNSVTGAYGAELQNLYLYYYPAYTTEINGVVGCASDKIVIDSDSDTLHTLYILKQMNNLLSASQAQYTNMESNYRADIEISSLSSLSVKHNLAEQLVGDAVTPRYSMSGSGYTDANEPWSVETDTTQLMYDIVVRVMPHGSTDVVCELEGSTSLK